MGVLGRSLYPPETWGYEAVGIYYQNNTIFRHVSAEILPKNLRNLFITFLYLKRIILSIILFKYVVRSTCQGGEKFQGMKVLTT